MDYFVKMMSIGNLLASFVSLLALVVGILLSNISAVTKASFYDANILQAPHIEELILEMDMLEALASENRINKRVAGFCHHDYETITEESSPNYFNAFSSLFPGDGEMTMRLEMDIFNIYNCESGELHDSVVQAAQWNIDQLQAAGYNVRIWFTEMPECLGQNLPGFITDAIPELTSLLRPHVFPSRNPNEFQDVVELIVRAFTIERQNSGKQPVTLYEGWNEVESPGYFFGTRDLLVTHILLPMIKAVEQVESEVGYELLFASHSVANGAEGFTPQVNVQVQNKIKRRGYDVDWINWHWYGTFPFHNTPPGGLEVLYEPIIRSNPFATPKDMSDQVRTMKARFPGKKLMISEWNAGAGGAEAAYDYRAAAYVAGALIECHHAGLDDANNFLLKAGDGFLNQVDQINPTGHAMRSFQQLAANEIEIDGIIDGDRRHDVSTIASFDDDAITIMLSRFFGFGIEDEHTTTIDLRIQNIGQWIDAESYTVHIGRIDETVVTGGEMADTSYIVDAVGNHLLLTQDLQAHSTTFILIDTSETDGRIGRVSSIEEDIYLNTFPNPSASLLFIQHDLEGVVDLEIVDISGRMMLQRHHIQVEEVIEALPAGEYFLRLRGGQKQIVRKIIFL